ncbi:MAG: hypothetical protein GFH27_549291n178 [Chloroflexi bacterium AL-W]|nr:hypothetical protein [Chloroflexi bacterium AL-N1]NOK67356.1 hypothetical protein [Chloroflexi bacterium AL-N10]NOK75152.1 hypothetical protein [Chloroflexi bacterium AL-N5]NOK81940.1 hypothetical protein [Chloroflexi bacterium AL-W]NOK89785.1 hypothetical protein [Chloroflexi bacterium AL-N15]
MKGSVIEVILCKLAEHSDEAILLQTVMELESVLKQTPGYIKRELSRNDNGQWIDIIHWQNLEQALAAPDSVMATEVRQRFGGMIALEGLSMIHVESVYTSE